MRCADLRHYVCCGSLAVVAGKKSQKTARCSIFYRQSLHTLCCSVLQCVTVCYSVLQCVAVHCSALQCIALQCSALQCIAVHCSALQCIAVHCSVLQCIAVCCSASQCVYYRESRHKYTTDLTFENVHQRHSPPPAH